MTREDKLYTMRMQDLEVVANKLGIKINKKAAKSKAIALILAAEEMNKENEKELKKEEAEAKKLVKKEVKDQSSDDEPSELKDLYDKINNVYFQGLLPEALIQVKGNGSAKLHRTVKDEAGTYLVTIGKNFIDDDMEAATSALAHEMIHIFCAESGIADTCQKGRYHNNAFAEECSKRDINVERDTANGYRWTTCSEAFFEKIRG